MSSPVEALVCPRCGAPLPLDLLATPRCGYCGVGVHLRGGAVEATSAEAGSRANVDPAAFMQAVNAALNGGHPLADAIRASAREHLGVLGESDALGRVTMAIARDFDREHPGTGIEKDGIALSRIAEAYLKALPSLRESGKAHLNLPFLAVSESGPVHLVTDLTPASLAAILAAPASRGEAPGRAPVAKSPQAPAVVEASPPAPKKRGWWPFGG